MDSKDQTTPTTLKPATAAPVGSVSTIDNEALIVDSTATVNPNREEAKSRFNAALEEAKAGAAALKAEASDKVGVYKSQARDKTSTLASDAKDYGDQAKMKAGELATEGKVKASEAISTLGKKIGENATYVDEKLGAKYGDYARSASQKLQDTSAKLDAKSVEDLTADAREMVRKSPGAAIGIAAIAGFFLSRLFSSNK